MPLGSHIMKPQYCHRCHKKLLSVNRIDCLDDYEREVAYHISCYDLEVDEPSPSVPPSHQGKQPHITTNNIKSAKRFQQLGYSQKKIAIEMGLTEDQVFRLLHWRSSKYKKAKKKQARTIGRLRYAGFNAKDIARIMDMELSTVRYNIRKHHYNVFINPVQTPKEFTAWVRKMVKYNIPTEIIAQILDVQESEVVAYS